MATVALTNPAGQATIAIRQQITNLKTQALQTLTSVVAAVKQNGRANIDAAFGADAQGYADDVAAITALLTHFNVPNIPVLPTVPNVSAAPTVSNAPAQPAAQGS